MQREARNLIYRCETVYVYVLLEGRILEVWESCEVGNRDGGYENDETQNRMSFVMIRTCAMSSEHFRFVYRPGHQP